MNRAALLLALMACLMSAGVTCETDLIDNAGFQLWCGERLCAWDLEEGEIRKVPTWHTHDYGIELIGPSVLLSQPSQSSASCVRIEVTSEIEPSALVSVEGDANGDGSVDWTVFIEPSDRFDRRVQDVERSLSVDGIVYLRKSGQGGAVVARLRVSRECGQ